VKESIGVLRVGDLQDSDMISAQRLCNA